MFPLEKFICSYEVALRLKELHIPQESLFYRNSEIKVSRDQIPTFTGEVGSLCSSFTSEELLQFLPLSIPIDKGIFVPNGKTYELISDEDLEEFRSEGALLISLRTVDDSEPFLTKYALGGRMVIAMKLQKGMFHNLLTWGETEADSRGRMVIQLIDDGILNFS
ncbi:hypothetical protein [uncultured Imperialibacter sp.]|uniref:hypothetical protein n=1 Tax=Imperialibacter sp. TaxID=2038411 RepID=UPI0030DB112C|tara:strand:- start:16273 stop:16764 length:492 start_codon:yes stop_codon:yes gene_type:complete